MPLLYTASALLGLSRLAGGQVAGDRAEMRGPRFLLVTNHGNVPLDIGRTPVLARHIAVDLDGATVREALDTISARAGFRIVYSTDIVSPDGRVRLIAQSITVAAALTDVLANAGVDVVLDRTGSAALVRRPKRIALQTGTLIGQVTDSTTMQGIAGVSVSIESTRHGAVTGDDGRYRIANIPAANYVVTARRIGYAPTQRSITIQDEREATLNFVLSARASILDEVVTTVTGNQRRAEVGNVIGVISADSVVGASPIASLTDLITARVPGVQVNSNTGTTGMSPSIRVRGISSLSLTRDPFLVVDGVRVANTTGIGQGASLQAGFGQGSGRLNDLNPNEVATIEIVKGPAAATLYGTDAANGVIVITTKRGRSGPPTWTAYGETGLVRPGARFLDNYYSWGHSAATGAVQQCVLRAAAARTCVIDSLTTFNPFTNDETSPISTGTRWAGGLQVRGGVGQVTYFLSVDGTHEDGYLRMPSAEQERVSVQRGGVAIPDEQVTPNYLSRTTFRSNVAAPLGKNADIAVSTALSFGKISIPAINVFVNGEFGRGYRSAIDVWSTSGPGEVFAVRNLESINHYTISGTSHWTPRTWLTTRATIGTDQSGNFLDALQRNGEGPPGVNRNGRRQNTRTNIALYTADVGATAVTSLSSSLMSRTSIGVQYNKTRVALTSITGTGLSPGSETITGASVITGAEQNVTTIVAGVYGEQSVSVRERLFLAGAIRADGGSAFGREFSVAIYPKLSASWIAVREPRGVISNLRLRAAYGASGVQPGTTAALTLLQAFTVPSDGSTITGASPRAIGNPNLKPERTAEFEAGFDIEFGGGRMTFEGTFYDKLSRDALIQAPLSSEVGVTSQWQNIGAVRNRGVEGLLSMQLVDRPTLSLDMTLNGSANRNRIETLGDGSASSQLAEGHPLFSRFARPIVSFNDANGDGLIEANEVAVGPTAVYLGASVPSRQLTTTAGLTLFQGRLRLSTQFDYRGGFTQLNVTEFNRCGGTRLNCRGVNDPRASLFEQARAAAAPTTIAGYIEDGSFVRWRELSASVQLPAAFTGGTARSATLVLSARNLHLFTKYSGGDPEVTAQPGFGSDAFIDFPTAPQSRYWLLRLNLGF